MQGHRHSLGLGCMRKRTLPVHSLTPGGGGRRRSHFVRSHRSEAQRLPTWTLNVQVGRRCASAYMDWRMQSMPSGSANGPNWLSSTRRSGECDGMWSTRGAHRTMCRRSPPLALVVELWRRCGGGVSLLYRRCKTCGNIAPADFGSCELWMRLIRHCARHDPCDSQGRRNCQIGPVRHSTRYACL